LAREANPASKEWQRGSALEDHGLETVLVAGEADVEEFGLGVRPCLLTYVLLRLKKTSPWQVFLGANAPPAADGSFRIFTAGIQAESASVRAWMLDSLASRTCLTVEMSMSKA